MIHYLVILKKKSLLPWRPNLPKNKKLQDLLEFLQYLGYILRSVKAFGVIFAVLTAFSFFGVLFYLSKVEMLEELNEDENIFGEWKI